MLSFSAVSDVFSFLVRQEAKNITLLSIQVGYVHYIRKSSCSIIDNKLQLNMP